MKKIELTEAEVEIIIEALRKYRLQLYDDIETTKEYPHIKADFDNQLNEIEPIFVKLERFIDEIDF